MGRLRVPRGRAQVGGKGKPRGKVPGARTGTALDAASNAGGGLMDWIMGGISMLPQIGVPIAAGAAIGTAYAGMDRAPAQSGRGAGRSTFNPPKAQQQPKPRGMANLPATYKEDELAAGKAAETHRAGAGFPDQQSTGRGAAAPNGGDAKGTQTSPRQMTMDEANNLLTGGYKVKNPFSSTQLPDTNGSPYYGNGQTPEYRSDVPEDMYDMTLSADLTDGNPFVTGDYEYKIDPKTNIEFLQKQGSPLISASGVVQASEQTDDVREIGNSKIPVRPRGGRQAEMWDRKYGRMNQESEPTESKSPNIDYARRSAFLDAPNSMQGLRRVEAQKGVVYAGGQHSLVNPNGGQEGESAFVKLDKPDRDAYMGGRMTADELKNKFVKKVSDKEEE